VDCALALVRLGKERQIPGLEPLCDDLVTMETLVYETSCELSLTLRDLQQLGSIHKLRLLMKNVRGEGGGGGGGGCHGHRALSSCLAFVCNFHEMNFN